MAASRNFEDCCKELDSLVDGAPMLIISVNMLAVGMGGERFFKIPLDVEAKVPMVRKFIRRVLKNPCKVIMGLQEIDAPLHEIILEEVSATSGYVFVHQEGFRFGGGFIIPKDLLISVYSFNVMSRELPSNVKIAVMNEWYKRESRVFILVVNMFGAKCILVFAHFPLSLEMPSLKVLFWESVRMKIFKRFGGDLDKPVIVVADTNTLPSEPTLAFIKSSTPITSASKFNPTEEVYESELPPTEYAQVSTEEFTNFATNPDGVVFKECIDRILANPVAVEKFSMKKIDGVSDLILPASGPNPNWFSDHAPVIVKFDSRGGVDI